MENQKEYRSATLAEVTLEREEISKEVSMRTIRQIPHVPDDFTNSTSNTLYSKLQEVAGV